MKTPELPERRYRYLDTKIKTRNDSPESHGLEGYFSVFGEEYELWPGVSEMIDPAAFDETLQNDDGSIRCLWNHDHNIVLGRTGNGTLKLRVDERGLYGEVELNENDSDAMNAKARIERGDVSQCSIGFEILEEEAVEREGGGQMFLVKRVKLWEVSPVTFPAYKETNISARKHDIKNLRAAKHKAWQAKMRERLSNGT